MGDYAGSNSMGNLQGLTKETYGKKIERLVPDTGKKKKFGKLKKLLNVVD